MPGKRKHQSSGGGWSGWKKQYNHQPAGDDEMPAKESADSGGGKAGPENQPRYYPWREPAGQVGPGHHDGGGGDPVAGVNGLVPQQRQAMGGFVPFANAQLIPLEDRIG